MPPRTTFASGLRRAAPVLLAALAMVGILPGPAAASRWGEGYLPNVELVTQEGREVHFYDDIIKGRVVVLSFIYTSCRDICPLVTARLAEVYEQLGDAAGKDIHFVSISIDPENDTPERLKQHADAFRSDSRWVFLTGRPENIKLVRHKLGERSRKLTEHGAQIMLYNDITGEWSRDSAFADLGALTLSVRSMVPEWRASAGLGAVAVAEQSGGAPPELPGQALFAKACATCHTIGKGARLGPDLDGVTSRRERDWLTRFIRAPSRMHASRDPIALELARQFPNVRMPNLQLSEADAGDVLTYLEARSFAVAAAASDAAEGRPPHDHAAHAREGHQGHGQPAGPRSGTGNSAPAASAPTGGSHDHQHHKHYHH